MGVFAMKDNGIMAVYDVLGDITDTDAKNRTEEYLRELEKFSSDTGKEYLTKLRNEKPDVYKSYSNSEKKSTETGRMGKIFLNAIT